MRTKMNAALVANNSGAGTDDMKSSQRHQLAIHHHGHLGNGGVNDTGGDGTIIPHV